MKRAVKNALDRRYVRHTEVAALVVRVDELEARVNASLTAGSSGPSAASASERTEALVRDLALLRHQVTELLDSARRTP